MSRKGCLSVTKYFLFIFNLFFFILGSLLFSFGLWILFDRNNFASVLGSSYYALKVWSYIFCGVGILTMLIGFLGCLGSLKEIKCMLGFYFTFLLLLFIAQITIGILIYTQRNKLRETVGDYVSGIINTYGNSEPLSDHDESWDFVQKQLQCCGWKSYKDWENNSVVRNASDQSYPCSCRNMSQSDQLEANNTASGEPSGFCNAEGKWPVYTEGCMGSVEMWLTNNIITIVGICLGIALLEFLQLLCMVVISALEHRDLHSGSSQEILYFPNRWLTGVPLCTYIDVPCFLACFAVVAMWICIYLCPGMHVLFSMACMSTQCGPCLAHACVRRPPIFYCDCGLEENPTVVLKSHYIMLVYSLGVFLAQFASSQ